MSEQLTTTLPGIRYNENILIAILLLITTVGQIAVDIYLPSMPNMQLALGTTKDLIQITLSVYTIGFGVSQIFYGPLSDRYGRRNLLIIGMLVYTAASLGCMMATSISSLIGFRLLAGIGGGAASVLTRAVLRDSFTGAKMAQVATYMSIAWSMIPITAPVLGSYIQKFFGWRGNFMFLMLFGIFIILCSIKWLPDTNQNKRTTTLHPKVILKNYWSVLTHYTAMRFSLGPMIVFACTISYATASPFLLQVDLGYSPVTYGWLSLSVACSYLLGNIVNTRLVGRYGKMPLIRYGIILNVIGTSSMTLLALLGFFNVYTLIIPASIMIFSGGFLFANCMSTAMIPFTITAGTAAAIVGCIQMLGGSIASAVVAHLPFKTPLPLGMFLMVLSAILILALHRLQEPQHD